MLGIILIALLAGGMVFLVPVLMDRRKKKEVLPEGITEKLDKLWEIARVAVKEEKVERAEKALLTILRMDEKNAAAYNKLGILYAKQRQFKEAIECFEIAQSLETNAATLHNVGLIYLETGNYEKAAMAFEQALERENGLANRWVAYAKAQEKMGDDGKAVEALEEAFKLEKSTKILKQIAEIYMKRGDKEAVAKIKLRGRQLIAERKEEQRQNMRARRTAKTQARAQKIAEKKSKKTKMIM